MSYSLYSDLPKAVEEYAHRFDSFSRMRRVLTFACAECLLQLRQTITPELVLLSISLPLLVVTWKCSGLSNVSTSELVILIIILLIDMVFIRIKCVSFLRYPLNQVTKPHSSVA